MWLWRASAGPMLAYVGHMLDLLGLCWVVVVVVVVVVVGGVPGLFMLHVFIVFVQ